MRRVLRTPPTKASQTADALLLDNLRVAPARGGNVRRTKGERAKPRLFCIKPESRGEQRGGACPFKVRANGLSIRHTSFRIVGRGRLQHQREEQSSDDGGRSFTPCFPEGRRSGDVGGAGPETPASLGKHASCRPRETQTRRCFDHHVIPAKAGIQRGKPPSIKRAQPYNQTMKPQPISSEIFETALGWIAIAATERGIVRASLPEPTPDTALEAISDIKNGSLAEPNAALHEAKRLLARYCNGEPISLDAIPVDHSAWTPYTQHARAACRTIPRGETRTYAWLAEQASGNPKSARAAGRAMATNPIPIIIPCHRVIGSNGNLHGFGGTIGLPLKARLLEMESASTIPRPDGTK